MQIQLMKQFICDIQVNFGYWEDRASIWERRESSNKFKRSLKLEFIKFVYYIMGDHLI